MEEVKQINVKNRTYQFYKDVIDLKDFDSNFVKIDKKSHKNIDIYTTLDTSLLKKLMNMRVFIV